MQTMSVKIIIYKFYDNFALRQVIIWVDEAGDFMLDFTWAYSAELNRAIEKAAIFFEIDANS